MKRMIVMITLLAAAGCGKSSSPAPAEQSKQNVFYVSPNGSDAATGTLQAPLKGINAALAKASPGDTVIVREGRYYEKVFFPKAGRLEKMITLKAYAGERPVIDGTGLSVSGKEALVTIRNASYVQIEGFDICNLKSSTPWVNVNGIVADAGSSNIVIRRNRIYNIEHNAAPTDGRSGHAIEIIGNTEVPMKNVLVEENEIHDCNTGYSENLTINGYVDGFIIRKNIIYNAENIGIDAAGGYAANSVPAYNYARNGLITENTLYNIDMTTGPIGGIHGHGAIAIYVDGARKITVERNRIYDCDRGIGIVSENDAFPTSDCIVRNNIVTDLYRTGIYLGGYLGYTSGGTRNCYVVNNTLAGNNRERGAYGEIEGELRLTEQCFDNVIRNNLVVAGPDDLFVHKYTNTGSGNMIDNNLYFSATTAGWIWNTTNGAPYTDFNAWKTASGMDANSIDGKDPLLTENYRIPGNSPARLAGHVLPAEILGTVDFSGQPRVTDNKISIGAHQ
ncbi:right-handed parallel beta-helix repeat-containing protein [Chitinophaga sp. GCM10012297]|uniref:Right-handed parallel beta-helix repeat-containing protein n=1 Tax=Chitinophaga chungangae TaxID=2821488 RepID=A0ABS3Y806_9BACT|nr:right-handed parallel beta-helix repeat-containing protein [Chitinophaga chungangae]MBO9150807.1 right-handed parallel beta-helix repeat-containing protein [Chitinophaga chungangae]